MKKMISDELVRAHRARGLTPRIRSIRGTSQNPDVYFASREAVEQALRRRRPPSSKTPWPKFASSSGRSYKLFEYVGAPDAERVVIVMGSGADVVEETVDYLVAKGEKVGVGQGAPLPPLQRRALHRRPFPPASSPSPSSTGPRSRAPSASRSMRMSAPPSARPWAPGRRTSRLADRHRRPLRPRLREFTPAMAKAVFDELKKTPRSPRTISRVGIERRRDLHQPRLRRGLHPRLRRRDRVPLLRPRLGRHGRRQQELHQDHRRRHPELGPGLLLLRLQEGRQLHDQPPPLRPEGDQEALPHRARPTSSPATSSPSSRSSTCSPTPSRAASSSSTAPSPPTRSGTRSPPRSRRPSSTRSSAST